MTAPFDRSAAPAPAPPTASLLGEWRVVREAARLVRHASTLHKLPAGDNRPVVLIPGLGTSSWTMEPIRRFLASKGFEAVHWGLGRNRGNPVTDRDRLLPRLRALREQHGRPPALVGWSLGGVIARECTRVLEREREDAIDRVITYGTPVVGGPRYTIARARYPEATTREIESRLAEADRADPIHTPVFAMFSRADAVVGWPACIDRTNPRVTHFEVAASHGSMGIDPTVWRLVLDALSHP